MLIVWYVIISSIFLSLQGLIELFYVVGWTVYFVFKDNEESEDFKSFRYTKLGIFFYEDHVIKSFKIKESEKEILLSINLRKMFWGYEPGKRICIYPIVISYHKINQRYINSVYNYSWELDGRIKDFYIDENGNRIITNAKITSVSIVKKEN